MTSSSLPLLTMYSDEQGFGRVHRLGQDKHCYLNSTVVNGTIDSMLLECMYDRLKLCNIADMTNSATQETTVN